MKKNDTGPLNRHGLMEARTSGPPPPPIEPLTVLECGTCNLRQTTLDSVTGFPTILTLTVDVDLLFDTHPRVGVVYLQIGKFSGLESAYGWELFGEILGVAATSLRTWSLSGEWKYRILSIHFNNVDGFYLVVTMNGLKSETPHLLLELLANQLRELVYNALCTPFGHSVIDLLGVFQCSMKLDHDPRVRASRQLHRAFKETSRLVNRSERKEQDALEQEVRKIITERIIHTVFQPIVHMASQQRVGYEALTRGPEGSLLENPEPLFAAARDNSLLMELESICQASAFDSIVAFKPQGRIFVNTSSNFITHPLFHKRLKESVLKKMVSSLVFEITEKEAIQNYHDFRKAIDPVRKEGIRLAVDDAGSGYADLESIAEVRPEYIKIANSITRNVSRDLIKQEIVSSFLGLALKLRSTVIAEGIETREDFHVLKRLGVEYGQGYFLGRPAQLVKAS
ncbi:MAG: EAL domain-containing protein [Acidobacteriia bacterium]|nr:EAL domain-containing protein [Terriglobia bacterium]